MRYIELTEKWSKKYKSSINCSNPKGFSQKAHCAGKKKKESIEEGKRIARKKGQKANSKKHSDLYTDENPKGTIHGLKFATVKDAEASVSKIRSSGKKHAHKIQAAVAMEQRAKAAGKSSAAAVYRKYINAMKKKTKAKNESLVESEINDIGYYNSDQMKESNKKIEAYKQHHFKEGWEKVELENPPDNNSETTKNELVTITNMQEKRTQEDENSISASDMMDAFHFREYLNTNNIDYKSSEISAIIEDVWKITRTFKNKYNRPRPYQMAEAYNMEFDTMYGESNKTPSYPSGHSCGARLVAEFLSKQHPDHKEKFLEIAERIGMGRIQAGFHYPSDHVSGIDLALKVLPFLDISEQHLNENFADGKKKGKSRPGRVKRAGASCKGSVTSLRAKAKKASGERAKMYHWCANMKSGKKK